MPACTIGFQRFPAGPKTNRGRSGIASLSKSLVRYTPALRCRAKGKGDVRRVTEETDIAEEGGHGPNLGILRHC